MRKTRIIPMAAFLGLACLQAYSAGITDEGRRLFLKMESLGGDSVGVLPLSANTVIKFRQDTIMMRDGNKSQRLPMESFRSIEPVKECLSPMKVKLTADSLGVMPVEGMYVTLSSDENLDYLGIVQKSDETGTATFPNLPYGRYSIKVFDSENFFSTEGETNFEHTYDDQTCISLTEKVDLPNSLNYRLLKQNNGLFTIELKWGMTENTLYGPYRNYLFTVYLDDEYYGETNETNFYMEDCDQGLYKIGISVMSWYGNPAEGRYETTVEIDRATAGTSLISENESTPEYFDLNGRKVASANLQPGIYIRKTGNQTEKIIVP